MNINLKKKTKTRLKLFQKFDKKYKLDFPWLNVL